MATILETVNGGGVASSSGGGRVLLSNTVLTNSVATIMNFIEIGKYEAYEIIVTDLEPQSTGSYLRLDGVYKGASYWGGLDSNDISSSGAHIATSTVDGTQVITRGNWYLMHNITSGGQDNQGVYRIDRSADGYGLILNGHGTSRQVGTNADQVFTVNRGNSQSENLIDFDGFRLSCPAGFGNFDMNIWGLGDLIE